MQRNFAAFQLINSYLKTNCLGKAVTFSTIHSIYKCLFFSKFKKLKNFLKNVFIEYEKNDRIIELASNLYRSITPISWKEAKTLSDHEGYEMFSPSNIQEIEQYADIITAHQEYGEILKIWTNMITCNILNLATTTESIENTKNLISAVFPKTSFEIPYEECEIVAVEVGSDVIFELVPPDIKLYGIFIENNSGTTPSTSLETTFHMTQSASPSTTETPSKPANRESTSYKSETSSVTPTSKDNTSRTIIDNVKEENITADYLRDTSSSLLPSTVDVTSDNSFNFNFTPSHSTDISHEDYKTTSAKYQKHDTTSASSEQEAESSTGASNEVTLYTISPKESKNVSTEYLSKNTTDSFDDKTTITTNDETVTETPDFSENEHTTIYPTEKEGNISSTAGVREDIISFEIDSRIYRYHQRPVEWQRAESICGRASQDIYTPKNLTELTVVVEKLVSLNLARIEFWTGDSICLASHLSDEYAETEDFLLDCIKNIVGDYQDIVHEGECKKLVIVFNNSIYFSHPPEESYSLPFICTAPATVPCENVDAFAGSRGADSYVMYIVSSKNLVAELQLKFSNNLTENISQMFGEYCTTGKKKQPGIFSPQQFFTQRKPEMTSISISKNQTSQKREPFFLATEKLPVTTIDDYHNMSHEISKLHRKAKPSKSYKIRYEAEDWNTAKTTCTKMRYNMFSPRGVPAIKYFAKQIKQREISGCPKFWTNIIACNTSSRMVKDETTENILKTILEKFNVNISFQVMNNSCGIMAIDFCDTISFHIIPPNEKLCYICTKTRIFFMPPEIPKPTPFEATSAVSVTNATANFTRYSRQYCEQRLHLNITWPRTLLGKHAHPSCPKGKYGRTSWYCDAKLKNFTGEPSIQCEEIDCSNRKMKFENFMENESYLAEFLSRCADNDTDPETRMTEFMDVIRSRIKSHRKKSLKEGLGGDLESQNEEIVNSALGAYDRLMDNDVKIWNKMNQDKKRIMAMDIIKDTEETSWLLGCEESAAEVKKGNLEMQVVPLDDTTEVKFDLDDDREDFAELPTNFPPMPQQYCTAQVKAAVAASYKNIQRFLLPPNCTYNITSNIMGISVGESTGPYSLGTNYIKIKLNHPPRPYYMSPKCVFLNWNPNKTYKYGIWDTEGCEVVEVEKTYTVCRCNHLTNFAILMDFTGEQYSETDEYYLSVLSLIFSCVSSVALILIIIIYVTVRSLRNRRSTFTCNLAACLLCMNILVQSGLEKVAKNICFVISALLQYCVLTSFLWMLLEGALLYQMVILVFETTSIRLPVVYGIAYGIPVIIITISSAIRPDQMIREKYCWPSFEKGMIWSVAGPIALIIMVNIIIFGMTMNAAVRIDKMNMGNKALQDRKRNLKKRVKGMLSLTCLLGFTWIVGFFYVPQRPVLAAYLFVTLNGLQGVFLFVTQMVLNEPVRHKLFVVYKENMAKFTSVTSTWSFFLRPFKPTASKKNTEDRKKNFSDVCSNQLHYYDGILIQPSAPSISEDSKSEVFALGEELRHPFEINYDVAEK